MTAWSIECASGRSFVVYAKSSLTAREHFARMMPNERVRGQVFPCVVAPTIAVVDVRRGVGA